MTTVYQYRVFCPQEGKYDLAWGTVAPTLCKNDHANRELDTTKTVIVDSVANDQIKVQEPYEGYYHATSKVLNVPSMSPSGTETLDFDWDSNIILWKLKFKATQSMLDDQLSIIAAPDTAVGTLTSEGSIGDTILNVTSGVVTNSAIIRGIGMAIDDGVNYQDLGNITNIDAENNQVTVKNQLQYNYAIGTPVKINIYIIQNHIIDYDSESISFGEKGLQGKLIPQGTTVRLVYNNLNGEAKTVRFHVQTYNMG